MSINCLSAVQRGELAASARFLAEERKIGWLESQLRAFRGAPFRRARQMGPTRLYEISREEARSILRARGRFAATWRICREVFERRKAAGIPATEMACLLGMSVSAYQATFERKTVPAGVLPDDEITRPAPSGRLIFRTAPRESWNEVLTRLGMPTLEERGL